MMALPAYPLKKKLKEKKRKICLPSLNFNDNVWTLFLVSKPIQVFFKTIKKM